MPYKIRDTLAIKLMTDWIMSSAKKPSKQQNLDSKLTELMEDSLEHAMICRKNKG